MILRPYQEEGVEFLAARRHALLADEMRLGKTPQAIRAACAVQARNVLVVCPAIAVQQWRQEFTRWWTGCAPPHLIVRSYDRAKMEREQLLAEQWDVTVVDECHFAKNPEAQRTKLVYGKDGLGWVSKRMWALSGTPAPKNAAELWPMLRAFGVTGMTYAEFVRRYCYCKPDTIVPMGTRVSMIPELRLLLTRVMLRRKRREVAPDMPDISYSFLNVEPVSHADLDIPADSFSDEQLGAWLESNPSADPEDRIAVAKAKALPLVEDIMFALENELYAQTVVFGWHTEPLQLVAKALQERGVQTGLITGQTGDAARQAHQTDFREGRTQVIVANILAAGTAIDLSAASHGYFLELDWVSGNNVQAANRLVSMDKVEKVTFDVVTWLGSVDDRVQRSLLRRVKELAILY